jgi:hypothetical protein
VQIIVKVNFLSMMRHEFFSLSLLLICAYLVLVSTSFAPHASSIRRTHRSNHADSATIRSGTFIGPFRCISESETEDTFIKDDTLNDPYVYTSAQGFEVRRPKAPSAAVVNSLPRR